MNHKKNLRVLRGRQGGHSQSLLLMEKTYKYSHYSNGRNTGATGAYQEGFLEEVRSKL